MTRDGILDEALDIFNVSRSDGVGYVEARKAFLASLKANGWRVVPEEPTEEMLVKAGATPTGVMPCGGVDRLRKMLPKYWSAMLDAAEEGEDQ